jgi:hypothetical protein
MSYIQQVAWRIRAIVRSNGTVPNDEDDDLYIFYALLALTVGEAVTRGNVHDAWAAWASIRRPSHDDIRPFGELSEEDQLEDEPFRIAIAEVARTL